ncbi:MAG: amidohydrolase family protein [Parcubacteria group bacterium]|nr:amidohydrolase family protein [Parcubacteria group bacterium]
MLLIKNIQIIDGTGKSAYKADVVLKGDRISAIGNFSNKKADIIINGNGAYLAPGFIDINTDSDHYLTLFVNPEQQDFLLQGVTTVIGGHCGSSLAPLIKGNLLSIRKWADPNAINVDWHSVGEFLNVLSRRPLGVNFGTLVGHSTVRRDLIGEELRDLSDRELAAFQTIVVKALEEGAFGMSSGLGYVHSRSTPYHELKILVEAVKKHGGVYTTHLRNEQDGIVDAVKETLDLAGETKAKTIISHLRPLIGFERKFAEAILLIEERAKDSEFYFDTYPSDTSIMTIYRLLPEWIQSGGLEVMRCNIAQPAMRERVLRELPKMTGDEIIIAQAPGFEFLVNKTLKEFADNRGVDVREGLLQLMDLTNLRTILLYKNINPQPLTKLFSSSHTLIASNSASFPAFAEVAAGKPAFTQAKFVRPERSVETFTKFLKIVEQEQLMTLEQAVHKITGLPSGILGLKDRGVIAEGNMADLTIFKNGEVKYVIVNGRLAVEDSRFKNVLAGTILRRQ